MFQQAMAQATQEFIADEKAQMYGGGRPDGRRIMDPFDINCGMCEEWAERVRGIYMELTGQDDVEVVDPFSMYGNPEEELCGHVFVLFNGRYYDAECPQGVDDWKQLPLFSK